MSYPLPAGATQACIHVMGQPEIVVMDGSGNPLVESDGCPNCGKGAGWVDAVMSHIFGAPPCSRACRLQLEYAAEHASMAFAYKHARSRDVLDYIAWLELCVRLSGMDTGLGYEPGAARRGRELVRS